MRYVALVLIFASTASAQWEWSPKADHHQAACQLVCDGSGGSGVVVEHNGVQGVLTCWHLFDGQPVGSRVRVTLGTGQIRQGVYRAGDRQADIAWVEVDVTGVRPLRVAVHGPKPGTRVEFVTYGGPNGGPIRGFLRHWWARVRGARSRLRVEYTSYVMSGDSGGAILNERHEVIGIQSTGANPTYAYRDQHGTTWPIYDEPAGASHTAIKQFCDQYCRPRGQVQSPRIQPPSNPVAPPATKEVEIEIDYDKLADLIYAKIKEDPDRFRGPAGPTGKQGPPGKDAAPAFIDYEKLASDVQRRLPPIRVIREGKDGKAIRTDEVALGGELRLPPIRMEIQHPGGQVYFQERAQGEVIALKLVPKSK